MNGPLGDYCTAGQDARARACCAPTAAAGRRSRTARCTSTSRSSRRRPPTRSATPTALGGPAACGPLGFALADSMYADHVIVVTDNLVPFPCLPWQIQGNNVDVVVEVDSIGDPTKIVSGTTADHPEPGPPADRRARGALLRRGRDHARRLLVPGRRRRHHAGLRPLPARPDARSRGHGALRPRRLDAVPGRDARGGARSSTSSTARPSTSTACARCATTRATCDTSPFTSLQLPRQGQLRLDGRRRGARRHRGRPRLQRQRRDPLRRPPAARHRRLAELPLRRVHDAARAVASATGSR